MRQEIKEEQVQKVKQEILDYDYGDQYQDGMVGVYLHNISINFFQVLKDFFSFVKIEVFLCE